MATRQTAGTRARDSDRDNTCKVLDTALSEGQLSMAEHRQRVSTATAATTLGELQALVADLQLSDGPVKMPDLRPARTGKPAGWGLRIAVAAVLVAFGVAVGWGLFGGPSAPLSTPADPGAVPDGVAPVVLTPPRALHSAGGLTGLFEQMRQKFGDTRGYGLTIFEDYASLERPDPAEPRRVLRYSYRGGWDDPSETSVGSDERVVDLAAFDVPTLVGVLRGAPETLGINPAEVGQTHISIDPNSDITAPPESIELSVYVSPQFGNGGYIELNGDGTVKRISYPS